MKNLMTVILTLGCASGAYLYYKMNPDDLVPAIIFGIGLLGILLSFLRNSK